MADVVQNLVAGVVRAHNVEAARVIGHALAEVIELVELDGVVVGIGGASLRLLSHLDGAVIEVVDGEVAHTVVVRAADPDAGAFGARQKTASVRHHIVADVVVLRHRGVRIRLAGDLADADAAGAEVIEDAVGQRVALSGRGGADELQRPLLGVGDGDAV